MRAESGFDRPCMRGADALVDSQRIAQQVSGLARSAVVQAAPAHAFQRPAFFKRLANAAGDGESLLMAGLRLAGLLGRKPQLAQVVEGLSFPYRVANVPVDRQRPGQALGPGREVPG